MGFFKNTQNNDIINISGGVGNETETCSFGDGYHCNRVNSFVTSLTIPLSKMSGLIIILIVSYKK